MSDDDAIALGALGIVGLVLVGGIALAIRNARRPAAPPSPDAVAEAAVRRAVREEIRTLSAQLSAAAPDERQALLRRIRELKDTERAFDDPQPVIVNLESA